VEPKVVQELPWRSHARYAAGGRERRRAEIYALNHAMHRAHDHSHATHEADADAEAQPGAGAATTTVLHV